ncbi:hypothetical protein LCGC14_1714020 [marine sediment metagenome]|uniref:Phage recombination protein Bet n=1 Tax=marine sediment metagenome TaxID=412755 RepID=A0A0F9I1T6_9ZZZZ
MDSKALELMDKQGMLARIEQAKFPQNLTPQDKAMLAEVATSYGLDPLMGELMIYQGRPYVSIDARYRKAQESGQLAGVETRPATRDEREAWEIPDGDIFMRSEVYRKGIARPFVGWGRVKAKEFAKKDGYLPVEVNPQRMGEKRAEAQALRKGFNLPLPSLEGETSDPFIEGEFTVAPVEIGVGDPPADAIDQEEGPDATSEQPGASPVNPKGDTSAEKDMRDLISKKVEAVRRGSGNVPTWCNDIPAIPAEKLDAAVAWFKDK